MFFLLAKLSGGEQWRSEIRVKEKGLMMNGFNNKQRILVANGYSLLCGESSRYEREE